MARRQKVRQDYNSLTRELLNKEELFVDPDFPPKLQSLYSDVKSLPMENIQWKRPTDLFERPEFIVDGAKHHDLDQGSLGNCWFIAGAAVLASSHPAEFQRVVPPNQSFDPQTYTGMFRFNFWWYGNWTEVIVDDYLPTDGDQLIYCQNRERQNEFWPCLLEKAYAKLYGSYESLESGFTQDAMVDLTGGISEVIDIKRKDKVPDLYNLLYTSYKMRTLMGASINTPENAPPKEGKLANGLYTGHAYSITGFYQIPYSTGTVNLLRMRNPWGKKEWNGPWSDGSPEMKRLSQDLKNNLLFENKDDGEFWMRYEDFINIFDRIELCHLQPDALIQELEDNTIKQQWNVAIYQGKWTKGLTAGGCGNSPNEKSFWKNPQFYVVIDHIDPTLGRTDKCTLIVSLMEKEKSNKSKIAIGFKIYMIVNPDLQPLEYSRTPENAQLINMCSAPFDYNREVSKRFELSSGTYIIVPSTFNPDEEAEFMLRIFSEKQITSGSLIHEEVSTPPLSHNLSQKAKPAVEKQTLDVFNKHAGQDQKMDASELCTFLQEVSTLEFGERLTFQLEHCRGLVCLMDANKSGFLSFSETIIAWRNIKTYRNVFKKFARDNSNTVDPFSLEPMFSILASFKAHQIKKGIPGEIVDFSGNEFLEVAIFP